MNPLPHGHFRDKALERVKSLDCADPDPMFASCDPDPALTPPPEAAAWRTALEDARADDATYAEALAPVLKTLVCSGGGAAIFVLRGLLMSRRLAATGSNAPRLFDDIMNTDESKDCPVSTSLTDADRAMLLRIKRQAIEP